MGERTSTALQLGCTGVIAVHSDSLLFSQFAASSAARGGYRIRQTRRGMTHAFFFFFFSFPFSGCDSDSESSQQYTRPARFGRKSPFGLGLGLGGSDSDSALGLGLGLCQCVSGWVTRADAIGDDVSFCGGTRCLVMSWVFLVREPGEGIHHTICGDDDEQIKRMVTTVEE